MSNKITAPAPTVNLAVQIRAMSDGSILIDTPNGAKLPPWAIGNLLLSTVNLIYQGLNPEPQIVKPVDLGVTAMDEYRKSARM
jgi:hypothetical protein